MPSGDTLLVLIVILVITGNQYHIMAGCCVLTPLKEGHSEKIPVTESIIIIMIIKTLALAGIYQPKV